MKLSSKLVQAWAEKYDWSWCAEYGEPGYSSKQGSMGVLLGNWNMMRTWEGESTPRTSHQRVMNQLEAQYDIEWSDEWVIDDDGNKAYRQSPDSYSWLPSFIYTESGDMITREDDIDTWIEWAINQPGHALMDTIHTPERMVDKGWTKQDMTYETGFHPHQTDDPKEVFVALNRVFPSLDVVFMIVDKGQFDVSWVCFTKRREDEQD